MTVSRDLLSTLQEITNRCGEAWLMRRIEIDHPQDGPMFLARLYKELQSIADELESSAHDKQQDSEDKLTRYVVALLRRTGYQATHDEDQKGHTDLLVSSGVFKWLGEAKLHRDYDWLFHGLDQLQTYATGREAGYGLLIYLRVQNAKGIMNEWRTRLSQSLNSHLKSINDGDEPLTFWSIHQHQASGADMNTKHIGFSMYYASPG